MKVTLLAIGKTDAAYLQTGEQQYLDRLQHYLSFEYKVLPALKKGSSLPKDEVKRKEGEQLLANIEPGDFVVLLDERGREYTSRAFADFLQKRMNAGTRHLVVVIGGAFGFSQEVYARANQQVALSQLTFSHQMVRLFFLEQLYRGMTILKGEKYHH